MTSAEAIGGSGSPRAVRRKSIADNSRPAPERLLAARDKTIPDVAAPGLRVLFASGSATEVPGPLLPKPWRADQLVSLVNRALRW